MRTLNLVLSLLLLAVFSTTIWADDDPQDDIGAQKYDKMQCVDTKTQNCIDDACLNSEEVDCESNCKTMAEQTCQDEINE